MAADKPLVSFIIAAYNEEEFIVDCVESCLGQTYGSVEVCVTDDGSSDGTWNVLETRYGKDSRVKLDRFAKNKGKVFAFNRSMSMAGGEYFAVLGADDQNMPDRIEKSFAALKASNGAMVVCGDLQIIDASGKMTAPSFFELYGNRPDPAAKLDDILAGNVLSGGTMFFGKNMKALAFPIPETLRFEDWWLAFIAVNNGGFVCIDEPLIQYRQHGGNDNFAGKNAGLRKWYAKLKKIYIRNLAYYDEFEKYLKLHPEKATADSMNIADYYHTVTGMFYTKSLPKRLAERKRVIASNLYFRTHLGRREHQKFFLIAWAGPSWFAVKALLKKR